jgi:peptidoglycan-N-acetylglucosamine deacetylase
VTLSFDNGPHPEVTPVVLEVLAKFAIRATFFVVGKHIVSRDGQALIAQAHRQGHWIGNHTFHHAVPLGRIPDAAAAVWEIERTNELIGKLAHPHRFFRPYGQGGILDERLLSAPVVDYLCDRQQSCVIWNAVPRDWVDPEGWVETALAMLSECDRSLMVLHDIAGGAMAHLERFIECALSSGVEFDQTIPEACMLIRDGKPIQALLPYMSRPK